MAAHRDQLDTEFMERVKSVEEEKIMASQKLADSEHKMINMQKVSFIVFKLASKLLIYSNRISSWTDNPAFFISYFAGYHYRIWRPGIRLAKSPHIW